MAKLDFKKLKSVSKPSIAVARTIKWDCLVIESNLDVLRQITENHDLQIGDTVDLEGEVFIKRINFIDQRKVNEAYNIERDEDDPEKILVKDIDTDQMIAAQLVGSVCEDLSGKPFFNSIAEVYGSDPKFIDAVFDAANSVNNFLGKFRKKSSKKMNSGANSSSMELAEEQ